jgi:hypothetical protein
MLVALLQLHFFRADVWLVFGTKSFVVDSKIEK